MALFGSTFWNLYALCYDSISRLIPYQEMMRDLVDAVEPRDGLRVLDAGCGTGNLTRALLDTGVRMDITAVDFSEAMLRRARKKTESASVQLRTIDLSEPLPFDDQTFDAVVANNVIYALPNADSTLRELRRITRSGGRLIINDPKYKSSFMAVFWGHLSGGGFIAGACRVLGLLGAVVLVPELLLVGLANVVIEINGNKRRYRFRDVKEWKDLLDASPEKATYAGQNWLFIITEDLPSAGVSTGNR